MKRFWTDLCYRIKNGNICQFSAKHKGLAANLFHAGWFIVLNGNAFQWGAIIKSIAANFCYSVGDLDTCQDVLVIVEYPVSDFWYRICLSILCYASRDRDPMFIARIFGYCCSIVSIEDKLIRTICICHRGIACKNSDSAHREKGQQHTECQK